MTPAEWIPILIALISAGLLKYAVDVIKWWTVRRKSKTPEGKQAANLATLDQSLAVVARARDELEADNARLRAQLAEADARHAVERMTWTEEKAAMKSEIHELERRLREMLAEIENLKLRHA
ncbi:SMC interacting uncharacterized protein involved in chromosome segregation [Kibdelosporangium banguiense]|uniref:SMC interacting uncharacterized protein involved in chromosome segregation n=1 Tax=Kibdelosporangium banguiense TaxID=1365924 RepID=A0ABS4TFZ3_9PSEU|nr:hypothetical protein [Kibdelosporangium banguiense]MBP2323342.1 SMC interacting uncharacterized protein involved in chromosome segregation [Kibdelosporangium banguiense]